MSKVTPTVLFVSTLFTMLMLLMVLINQLSYAMLITKKQWREGRNITTSIKTDSVILCLLSIHTMRGVRSAIALLITAFICWWFDFQMAAIWSVIAMAMVMHSRIKNDLGVTVYAKYWGTKEGDKIEPGKDFAVHPFFRMRFSCPELGINGYV